ncbi:hypothetical protein [Planotetraspora kaengkrachanensis]|uniref:Uncharacterized protein n=1 Tax=Planotetraspora kaengkrachanensis TaxID=575193 RepID=A0A8J3M1F3_9ACTN|nr:hypothetical protein [Planotetraspora kaengkrachanensis]GIG77305.1 hypothetical protein Pka01_04320 [Planotetraspora kaengkrachanensis]
MGVDAALMRVNQAGTSPRRRKLTVVAFASDHDEAFVRLIGQIRGRGTHPMLERVDPHRSLILTPAEMPQFLQELARLPARTARDMQAIRNLEDLARQCAADPMTELHLDGD